MLYEFKTLCFIHSIKTYFNLGSQFNLVHLFHTHVMFSNKINDIIHYMFINVLLSPNIMQIIYLKIKD